MIIRSAEGEGQDCPAGRCRAEIRDGSSPINDPAAFATDYDAETERQVTPFYRNQIVADRARIAEMNALEQDKPLPPANAMLARFTAASEDADVFRAAIEIARCVSLPQDAMARPDIAAKLAACEGRELPPDRGMERARLMALLDSWGGLLIGPQAPQSRVREGGTHTPQQA